MVEVVGILIAASDRQHARTQDIGHAVRHQQRIARIGDERCEPVGETKIDFSTWASSITPPSEVMRPPSNAAVTFLRSTAGKLRGSRLSSTMAGVACVPFASKFGFHTPVNLCFKSVAYATFANDSLPCAE